MPDLDDADGLRELIERELCPRARSTSFTILSLRSPRLCGDLASLRRRLRENSIPPAVRLFRPRMELIMHALEPLIVHVRVNLRGGNVGMTQHLLNYAKIGAVLQKMRGKTVA